MLHANSEKCHGHLRVIARMCTSAGCAGYAGATQRGAPRDAANPCQQGFRRRGFRRSRTPAPRKSRRSPTRPAWSSSAGPRVSARWSRRPRSHLMAGLSAVLAAWLSAWLSACLSARLPACISACLPSCLRPLPASSACILCLPACISAFISAFPACLPASLPSWIHPTYVLVSS